VEHKKNQEKYPKQTSSVYCRQGVGGICTETKSSSFTKYFLENGKMATTSTRPYTAFYLFRNDSLLLNPVSKSKYKANRNFILKVKNPSLIGFNFQLVSNLYDWRRYTVGRDTNQPSSKFNRMGLLWLLIFSGAGFIIINSWWCLDCQSVLSWWFWECKWS
jgi:hypothetical protein